MYTKNNNESNSSPEQALGVFLLLSHNESFRQEISKKLGKLVEETSFFVPVDKETKNTFPLIKTVAHGEALPIFTSYDPAKEMYSEDNYLVTPILLQWLKTLSGVSHFVINPNFQDFVFTYEEGGISCEVRGNYP